MKKLLKISLILAAVFVVLAGAAAVAVKIFLPPEKLKSLAISQADSALGRKLELKSVDFGLFAGLRIEGLRLSERPDFSKGEFLKADAFVLRFSWLPLLSKRFEAGKVLFQGLEASIKRGKDGQFNFSDLAGSGKAEPAAKAQAAGAPLALQMRSAQIEDSRVSYADEKEGSKAVLKINDASVAGFTLSGPFSVSVDVDADYSAGKSKYSGSLKAKGKADLGNLEPAKMSADFTKFALKTQGKEASGTLRFKDAASPKVEASLSLPAVDGKFLNSLAQAGLPPDIEVPSSKLECALSYAAPALEVSSFRFELAGLKLSGKGTLRGMDKGGTAVSIEASAPDMDLAKLAAIHPQTRGAGLKGQASLKLSADLPAGKAEPRVSVELTGSLASLDMGALEKAAGGGGAAPAKPAAKAAAKAPYTGPVLKTSGNITVDKVAHPNFNCGKAELSWSLTGVTPDFNRTDGTAKLLTAGGQAAGLLDMAKAKGGVVRALVTPLIALDKARSLPIPVLSSLPSLQNLPFTKIEGDYSVVKGVLEMKPFAIDGPVVSLMTTGKVDMPNETTDLRAATKLPVGSVVLLIKGPLASPSIRPDITKQINEVKEKGLEILQKQGGELLKRIFK